MKNYNLSTKKSRVGLFYILSLHKFNSTLTCATAQVNVKDKLTKCLTTVKHFVNTKIRACGGLIFFINDSTLYAEEREEDMPTQKKFFVLSVNRSRIALFPTKLCVVVANVPQQVADLLGSQYEDISHLFPKRKTGCVGKIFLPKALFRPSTKKEKGWENYLEYECGPLQLSIHKDEDGADVFLEELPAFGVCHWYAVGGERFVKSCDKIGTLLDGLFFCPEAYRLTVDDNYKEDKKDK